MKKLLLTIAICFIFTMGVVANSGSAVIPTFNSQKDGNNYQRTTVQISNITKEPINVEILLYKSNGNLWYDILSTVNVTVANALNFDGSSADNSFQFSLNGNQTCCFTLHAYINGHTEFGYGIIKWTQNSPAVHGLVARGQQWCVIGSSYAFCSSITINNGQPF